LKEKLDSTKENQGKLSKEKDEREDINGYILKNWKEIVVVGRLEKIIGKDLEVNLLT